MNFKRLIFYLLLIPYSLSLLGQQHKIDSLLKVVQNGKDDTSKVKHLLLLAKACEVSNNADKTIEWGNKAAKLALKLSNQNDLAEAYVLIAKGYELKETSTDILDYYERALKIYRQTGNKSQIARITCNIGNYYVDSRNYPKAADFLNSAFLLFRELDDKRGLAAVYTDMGILEMDQGSYPKALENYMMSLKMDDELQDIAGISMDYNAIGNVYAKLNDNSKALEYMQKSLDIAIKQADTDEIARSYGNMGIIYDGMHNLDKARECEQTAMSLYKHVGNKVGVYNNMGNIGSIFEEQKSYDSALVYYNAALVMANEIEDKLAIVRNTGNIGVIYKEKKLYPQAEKNLLQALEIAKKVNYTEAIKDINIGLRDVYSETGQWQKAYNAFVESNKANDSLVSAGKSKEIGKIEAKADYDKQLAVQQADEEKKAALAAAEHKKQKIIIGFTLAIVIITGLIALIIFRSLWLTKRQKKLIEEQKNEVENQKNLVEKQKNIVEQQKAIVEEKNKEITDSITYAKRLQDAILPPLSELQKHLPESFVLYKPKDIVAGDFYWFQQLNSGEILVAACDCTGHGVPGAMVSVVCSNALNRTVKEFKITEPGKILDKTRELVLETFSQKEMAGNDVKDGMDISLLALTPAPLPIGEGAPSPKGEGYTMRAQWAGAYNSLWYIDNGEFKELAGDKQPIGKTDNPKPFTTHAITFSHQSGGQRGAFYLFTDGYADQFGGPKGKKYKYNRLSEKLKMLSEKPMDEQRKLLEKDFETWKGNLEQTDDVCVIGIRL